MGPAPIKYINRWLKNQYGKDFLSRPIYRIVWANDELEKRAGTFREFSGPIFIREFVGIKEVPKYANPAYKDRYILEKLIFGIDNKELWSETKSGTYEPVWTFTGPNNTMQLPTLKTTDFVLRMLLGERTRRNQKMEDSDDEAALAQEIKDAEEALGVHGGDLASHLHTGSGVTVG